MAENYIDKIEVDGVERPIRDTNAATKDEVTTAIQTAIQNTWEASY